MTKSTWTPEAKSYNSVKKKLIEYYVMNNYAQTPLCINAFERVARSLFIPDSQKKHAYEDSPLSIGYGQTISAPHMAFMECDALDIKPGDKILEIGSGSGYHASIAAEMCAPSQERPEGWQPLTRYYNEDIYQDYKNKEGKVFTVERIEKLYNFALENIKKAGYSQRITVIHSDGTLGYPSAAPYDKIFVTAAAPNIPETLKNQLKIGGKLIIPVGSRSFYQELTYIERQKENKWLKKEIGGVVFVPLIGKYGWDS